MEVFCLAKVSIPLSLDSKSCKTHLGVAYDGLFAFQIQGFTSFISLANGGCQLKINGVE